MNKISGEEAGLWGVKMWQMLLTMLQQESLTGPALQNFTGFALEVSESFFCS